MKCFTMRKTHLVGGHLERWPKLCVCSRPGHPPEEPEGATGRGGDSPPQPRPWAAVPLMAVLLPLCRCGG